MEGFKFGHSKVQVLIVCPKSLRTGDRELIEIGLVIHRTSAHIFVVLICDHNIVTICFLPLQLRSTPRSY